MREMWRWPGLCEATSKTLSNSIYFVSSFCRVIRGFRVPTSKKATRCNRVCTGSLCFHVVGVLTEGTGTVKTFGPFGWYGHCRVLAGRDVRLAVPRFALACP